MNNPLKSIFELYKIGPGPSSSHSMGPARAAHLFYQRLNKAPAKIRVTLQGSLADTGKGHMIEQALARGLPSTPLELVWDTSSRELPHPNTLRFEAIDATSAVCERWTVYSVGGGSLADDQGPVAGSDETVYPVKNITEAMAYCEKRGLAFWEFVRHVERNCWPRLIEIWRTMAASVQRGIYSAHDFLPGPLMVPRRAPQIFQQAQSAADPDRDFALISAFALAVAEENADGGVVVTAPSCGASGVLPAILHYFRTVRQASAAEILQALATAGLFGSAIRTNASISGAVVGCQGEIGSGCSMAAAAAAQLLGGTLRQIEYAAEIAMEHHLGLTCDPVGGYVQIPCIERNMAAAWRAYESASFALLTDGRHLISFDEVIQVMSETGRDLQSKYRETARGGLAALWDKRLPSAGAAKPAVC